MELETNFRLTFTTKGNQSYSYVHVPSLTRPTILLLHGFPSHSEDWYYQIQYFSRQGYGIVAPDLIGYGYSSKPDDVLKYRLRSASDDVIALLDSLGLCNNVIGIGHDTGSTLLSRLAAYQPNRWAALIFLAVGPAKMGTPFDVNAINQLTKEMMGHEMLGYMPWIGGDTDAQAVLEKHAESAMTLMFCADPTLWEEWFRPAGRMKEFVSQDKRADIGAWYSKQLRQKHLQVFGREGGYRGAALWYRMWMENLFLPDEKDVQNCTIIRPSLLVVPEERSGAHEEQKKMLKEWFPMLQTVLIQETGHWLHLEKAAEVNEAIGKFLDDVVR